MKKLLLSLFFAFLLTVTAFCSEIVLLDFGKEADGSFGLTQDRMENITYDNESICWTNTTSGNSGLKKNLSSYNIDGIDYRYIVSRFKIENDVNTKASIYRFYFGRVDKTTGTKTHDIWTKPYESFSSSVPYNKNGSFITYVFDLTTFPALCTGTDKIGDIFYGAGLDTGTAGVKVYSDYLAFVPEDKYNVKIYLDKNTTEELSTPLPQYTTVTFGSEFVFDSIPYRRNGYKIKGWSLTKDGEIADLSCIKGETTLYAIWEEDSSVYVNFKSNTTDEVSGIPSEFILAGNSYTFDGKAPVREGYYFLGWSTDKNAADGAYSFENITSNTTLYAIWEKSYPVQIHYEANRDGDTIENMPMKRTVTVQKGRAVSLPEKNPVRIGYTFAGWSTSLDAKDIVQDGFIAEKDLVLYAIWKGENDGELINDPFVFTPAEIKSTFSFGRCAGTLYDDYISITGTVSDSNDVFLSPKSKINLNAKAIDRVVVTAEFIPVGEHVSFNPKLYTQIDNDSNFSETHSIKINGNTADGKKQYVFDLNTTKYWKDASTLVNFRYDPYDESGIKEVKIYKIELVSDNFIASFNGADADSGETDIIISADGNITLPTCGFVKDGFIFDGWTDGQNVYKAGEKATITQSITFKAVWKNNGSLKSATVLYPDFARKAFLFGSDDGANADKRVIATFNKYGIKGSFNLVGYKYANYTDTQLEELRNIYAGHEIVNHSYSHFSMKSTNTAKTDEDCINDMIRGEEVLEKIFGQKINGFIWPITTGDRPAVLEVSNERYLWARSAPEQAGGDYFGIPETFKPAWAWTCVDWNANKNFIDRYTEEYLGLETDRLTVYTLWCHANNYDAYDLWDVFDRFIDNYTGSAQNIWNPYPTDYVKYINATRELVIENDYIFNPTNIDIYAEIGSEQLIIPAYSYYDGKIFTQSGAEIKDGNATVTYYADGTDIDHDFSVILAGYTAKNKLTAIKIKTCNAGQLTPISETLDGDENIDYVKIFAFDSLSSISPLDLILVGEKLK